MEKKWLPLEANPEVMQSYVSTLGGPSAISFVDVLSDESWALDMLPTPVYSLLLLFPLTENIEQNSKARISEIEATGQELSKDVWHMKQSIGNACGTIGLIHAVANIKDIVPCAEGGYFQKFFEKCEGYDYQKRGEILENDDEIEKYHSEVQNEGQSAPPSIDDNVIFHFVAIVEKEGCLYELDGRKPFPLNCGKCSKDTFAQDATAYIRKNYMDKNPDEMRFSMIALCAKAEA